MSLIYVVCNPLQNQPVQAFGDYPSALTFAKTIVFLGSDPRDLIYSVQLTAAASPPVT
jgi:hypothetical protein